ncbi:fibronectin type III [Arthrobacter sp. UYCo732]|uniref:fibronectin type III n=1 Tax=Arthrobacter sp. UYCo732 TaxID=3156336 RepID=UPI00339815C8
MALKNLIDRYKKRRRDAGMGIVDAVVGIGLAAVIIGGPIVYFTTVNNAAAGGASTQSQNTAISEALDRAVANIQASNTIAYAGPNELVTRSMEIEEGKADVPVVTRWLVNGTTLYRQTWSGPGAGATEAAAYNRTTAVSNTSVTSTVVDDLKLDGDLFSYTDKDGTLIDVKAPKDALTETGRTNPADSKRTYDIALVNLAIKAGTTANGGRTGVVEAKTSAAPRSVSGKATGLDTTPPMCPAVSISTDAAGKPVVTWSTLAGYTSYQILRNGTQVAVVTAAASDTQKSWTDAAVTAGPAEVVQYRVHARNADGTVASISCMPKAWSPQIDAPVFKNSTVLPTADQAHEWTDGVDKALALKKPRIVLKWAAVAGATSYELKYRELDPTTGNPLTPGFTAVAVGLPAATTTFTWDEGGWASSYEWFIKANAGAGQGQSAESAHIVTLTHPPAPQNVKISPQYGTGATRLTHGTNVVTWDASPTAVSYDVWKYVSGNSGPVTFMTNVMASSARTFSESVPYGTTTTYYIAAINDGPRGNSSGKASSANPEAGVTSATGLMPTVSYKAPAGGGAVISTMAFAGNTPVSFERAASTTPGAPDPKPATQLQFPPVPDEDKSRDYDGYNQLVWNPTLSATGYQVARFDKSGAKTCLTQVCGTSAAGGIQATTLKDNAAQGTQSDYAVIAYNATGLSVEFSAKETLTQRPAAPALEVVRAPSLTDRSADFRVVQNADAGNTGPNRFCTAATCEYDLYKSTTKIVSTDHTQSGANVNWTGADSPDGSTTTFTAKSKNEAVTNGGYSDATTTTVKTYPGKFSVRGEIGDAGGGQQARYRLNVTNIDLGAMSNGATTVRWGSVPGGSNVKVVRNSLGGDTVSPNGDASGLSRSAVRINTYTNGAAGVWDDLASPGAIFQYTVTATADNGLAREIKSQPIITPADTAKAGVMISTCSGTDTRQFSAAQVGNTADGSFYRGAYSNKYGSQVIGTKMVNDGQNANTLDGSARYGFSRGTDYYGIQSQGDNYYSPKNFYYTGWAYHLDGQWGGNSMAAGLGIPYYQGATSGFDVVTRGITFDLTNTDTGQLQKYVQPDSKYITPTNQVIATYQDGCAGGGQTGHNLIEPRDACYSFDGTNCSTVQWWNRPKWISG